MTVCIVGGGILGLSIAFELTQKGVGVEHVYSSGRKGGATQCAGAMLNSFAEIDKYSLKSKHSLDHFSISFRATKAWPDFERRLIEAAGESLPSACSRCQIFSGGCFARGTYVINNTSSDILDDHNYDAIRNSLKDFNASFADVSPDSIPGYQPSQRSRATRALLIHDEGWLNPNIVVKKLDAILKRSRHYKHLDSDAKELFAVGNTINAVSTSNDGVIKCDRVVLANGYDLSELFRRSELAFKHRIFSGVGVSIELETSISAQKNCIRTPNRGGACGIYAVPYFRGPEYPRTRILVGASNFVDIVPHYFGRAVSVSHLLEAVVSEVNQYYYSSEVVSVNVGNRPITYDQYPLIGKTEYANLYVAGGTKRDGFHLAPLIGAHMAGLIYGDYYDIEFESFSPIRETINDISTCDGIAQNVESLISEAFQHGYVPATVRGYESLRRQVQGEVEQVHETKNPFPGSGIPPLMYKLVRDGKISHETF